MTQKIIVKDIESLDESEITICDKCFEFWGYKYPLLFLCLWLLFILIMSIIISSQ